LDGQWKESMPSNWSRFENLQDQQRERFRKKNPDSPHQLVKAAEEGICGESCERRKKGGGVEISFDVLEACGDGGVEDVHYVPVDVVDDYRVSIIGPDCEGGVSNSDGCDVVAEVGSDVDCATAPVGSDG